MIPLFLAGCVASLGTRLLFRTGVFCWGFCPPCPRSSGLGVGVLRVGVWLAMSPVEWFGLGCCGGLAVSPVAWRLALFAEAAGFG